MNKNEHAEYRILEFAVEEGKKMVISGKTKLDLTNNVEDRVN